jgi:quercetin dioxygenase-like cupin family protein
MPPPEAFDNGEKPVNVDSTNIVWLDASDSTWIQGKADGSGAGNAEMAFMWGAPEGDSVNGTMVKLPGGFSGTIESDSSSLKIIVIKGQVDLRSRSDPKTLTAGGYIGSQGNVSHSLACAASFLANGRTGPDQ